MAERDVVSKLILQGDSTGVVGAIEKAKASTRGLNSDFDMLGTISNKLGPMLGGIGLVSLASQLLAAGMASERLRNSFEAAAGSVHKGAEEYAFARAEANRLGLDLQTTADAYLKLTASARGTNLEGEKTQQVFSAVSGAGRALGLSSDQMSGALLAISQMMSKGTVQAEELRGQLGERIPGAFNIAARAMGVSTMELGKMLEGGKVLSEDFLPKFAVELEKTFPPGEKAIHGMTAETQRLKTAWFELKTTVMDNGGDGMFSSAIRDMTRLVKESDSFYSKMSNAYGVLKDFAKNPMDPNLGGAPIKSNLAPLNRYEKELAAPDFFGGSGPSGGASYLLGSGDNIFAQATNIGGPSKEALAEYDKAHKAAAKIDLKAGEARKAAAAQLSSDIYQMELRDMQLAVDLKNKESIDIYEITARDMENEERRRSGNVVSLAHWAAVREQNREKEEQAEFDHQIRLGGIVAQTEIRRLEMSDQEDAALVMRHYTERQRIIEQTQWKLDHQIMEESEKRRLNEETAAQLLQLDQDTAQRRADLWWNSSQQYIGFAQNMSTMAVSMLLAEAGQRDQIGKRMLATSVRFIAQGLQQFMFGKAKEHLLTAAAAAGQIQTRTTQAAAEMTIGATMAAAWSAFYFAQALNPYGGQSFLPAAKATAAAAVGFGTAGAAVATEGAVSIAAELGLAALWAAGGIAVGAMGEAGAGAIEGSNSGQTAGYTTTAGSALVTQPVSQPVQSAPQYTIILNGAIGERKWFEDNLPGIMKDMNSRNVDLGVAYT